MPQQEWTKKRERQYEHVEDCGGARRPKRKAKEIAARTVNKERARSGEARSARASPRTCRRAAAAVGAPARPAEGPHEAAAVQRGEADEHPGPLADERRSSSAQSTGGSNARNPSGAVPSGMKPKKLDHVAYWVADRDPVADFVTAHLGMHVIDRTEVHAGRLRRAPRQAHTVRRRGPARRGALKHVALRVSSLDEALGALPAGSTSTAARGEAYFDVGSEGVRLGLVEAPTDVEYDLDHVALFSATRRRRRRSTVARLRAGAPGPRARRASRSAERSWSSTGRAGRPGETAPQPPRRAGRVGGRAHRAANELGVEIDDVVDAANTYAVFLWGPEHVRVEYVEHKPTLADLDADRRRRDGRARVRRARHASSACGRAGARGGTRPGGSMLLSSCVDLAAPRVGRLR